MDHDQDQVVKKMSGAALRKFILAAGKAGLGLPDRLGYAINKRCQKRLARSHYRQRLQLIKSDTQRQRTLAFTGDTK